jgi:hypothetical protein
MAAAIWIWLMFVYSINENNGLPFFTKPGIQSWRRHDAITLVGSVFLYFHRGRGAR